MESRYFASNIYLNRSKYVGGHVSSHHIKILSENNARSHDHIKNTEISPYSVKNVGYIHRKLNIIYTSVV